MVFSITNYVRQQLKRGYNPETIREVLLNSGYSPFEIDKALKYMKPKRKIVIPTKAIAFIVGTLIVLAIIVVIALKLLAPVPKEIDLKLRPLKTQFNPGDEIVFIKSLTSNTLERADVPVLTLIKDSKTKAIVASKMENIVTGEASTTETRVRISNKTKVGRYFVEVTFVYASSKKKETFDITIGSKKEIEKVVEKPAIVCPESCDDYNACTIDSCVSGVCVNTEVSSCCGNGVCEEGETGLNCKSDCVEVKKVFEVKEIAKKEVSRDVQKAAVTCNSIPDVYESDLCFSEIAEESGSSVLCESIQDSERKDECFISFALNNDFSVCEQISSPYYLRSCYSLQKAKEMEAMAEKYR